MDLNRTMDRRDPYYQRGQPPPQSRPYSGPNHDFYHPDGPPPQRYGDGGYPNMSQPPPPQRRGNPRVIACTGSSCNRNVYGLSYTVPYQYLKVELSRIKVNMINE